MTDTYKNQTPSDRAKEGQVQGEGDYVAGRRFQEAERSFAKDADKVSKGAQEAEEALDGPEGPELEEARRESAKGEPRGAKPA
jgi:hypothetical protein